MARNNFLDQIRRAREAAEKPSEATERETKPIEQMSGEELDEALNQARRDLLDAQHAELREREIARVSSAPPQPQRATTLQDVLRDKQRGKRATWR
jgi:DNA-directed RNA polymerase specialized sigma24 family protein